MFYCRLSATTACAAGTSLTTLDPSMSLPTQTARDTPAPSRRPTDPAFCVC